MAQTLSNAAKTQIMRKLRSQGYPSYARLLDLFDIYLTDDPDTVGYMMPGKAKIVLNQLLDIEQVSTVVRHEILHEYFTHMERTQKFNAEHKDLLPLGADHEASNIAGDFEISNKGYTEEDKKTIRSLTLGDKILRGLVTEDQYPGWENMSFEEMYEKILEERKKDSQEMKKLLDMIKQLNKKELEDMIDDLEDIENEDDGEGSPNSFGNDENKNGSSNSKEDDKDSENKSNGSPLNKDEGEESEEEKDLQDKAGKLKDEIEKIQDKLEGEMQKNKQKPNNGGEGPFSKGKKIDPDLVKRVAQIKEIFADIKAKDEMLNDSKRAKQKEKMAKKAKEERRRKEDPLSNFKLNLNRFIADQIEEMEDDSYARVHPSYEDSEFILPGKLTKENKNIPVINVYQDASGSFEDPAKTEMAYKAIDTLKKYEREGKLKIEKYYHANTVGSTREEVGWGNDGNNVIRHINATKPTNVIIITDGDLSSTSLDATVPGAVWMLFYGARSEGLMEHLRGKKQTKFYDVKW